MKSVVRFGFFLLLCAAILLPATAFSVEDGEIAVNEESFPDPVFREWILDENNIGAVGADGILTKEEREAVTRISVPGMGISSLKGVELFPELQVLICRNNLLTTLDVSKNSKLVTLLCDINRLTTLDLSQNPKLANLNCELNYLTELNLRGCTELD